MSTIEKFSQRADTLLPFSAEHTALTEYLIPQKIFVLPHTRHNIVFLYRVGFHLPQVLTRSEEGRYNMKNPNVRRVSQNVLISLCVTL